MIGKQLLSIMLLLTCCLMVGADTALEISGFGDFLYVQGTENTDDIMFLVNQAEIDLESTIDDKITVGVAVAYDGEETFGLGAFTIDFHVFGSEGDHFRPTAGIDHSGIIVGQFDVPFGIDWHVYPSIDRRLVSGPLAVENTHDFWNDFGVQLYATKDIVNGVVYATNGFGYEMIDTLGMPVEVDMKMAGGGRLGICPVEILEVGGNFAGFFNQENTLDMSLLGIDLQFTYDAFFLKGEYIIHEYAKDTPVTISNSGFYVHGEYNFDRFFLMGRYGVFSPDGDTDDVTRLTAGAGYVLRDGCELRFEYQSNSGDDNDAAIFQVAAGF